MRHTISFTDVEVEAIARVLGHVTRTGELTESEGHYNAVAKAWTKFDAVMRVIQFGDDPDDQQEDQEGMEDEREAAGGGQDVG